MMPARRIELVCPAGTPAALRTAVNAGADAVYCGFRDETNARNFPGLNFSREELREAVAYAHHHGVRVLVTVNTFPRAGAVALWQRAIDEAADAGADAVLVADIGLLDYVARVHPALRLHLSVQAAAASSEAINFYVEAFGIGRVVLPRVLTVAEIAAINQATTCETEVFVFGGLCVMAEGRCALSSYATGKSPNMNGVCSPPSHVRYDEENDALVSRLGGFTVNRVARGEPAAYPTLCKGCFRAGPVVGHLFEEPTSLDASAILPALHAAGVAAVKIEGRQRSRAYVHAVVSAFREALDALEEDRSADLDGILALAEGRAGTVGAYDKRWR